MVVAAAVSMLVAVACELAWRSLPPAGPAASVACSERNPLPAGLADQVASQYPGRRFTIAVDDQSGCLFTMNPLWTRSSLDGVWTAWTSAGGIAVSAPSAAGAGDGSAPELFARGLDGDIWRWTFSSNAWHTDSWSAPQP